MERLDGRVALITGAARGIGAETARRLALAGAAVLLTDVIDGVETAEAMAAQGLKAAFEPHDVTDEAAWARAVAAAESRFGGLDILVNNAGILLTRSIAKTTLADFRRVQAVNTEGVFLGLKAAIPAIAARAMRWEGGGAIVNLSSVAGLVGGPGAIAYHASKGAVRLMTKAAALECAALGYKIRVNSVHPGLIDTPMGGDVLASAQGAGRRTPEETRARLARDHPLGRLGVPADIAQAILFLVSDAAAFMTGSEVVVDGGFTAR